LLEVAEQAARLETELVAQQAGSLLVHGKRLRLSLRPVERKHPLRAEALSERVLRDQGLELRDDLGVPAQREIGV